MFAFFGIGLQEVVILGVLIVAAAVFAVFMVRSGGGKDGEQ